MCCCWHNSPTRTAFLGSSCFCPNSKWPQTLEVALILCPCHLLAKTKASFSFSPTEADRFSRKPIVKILQRQELIPCSKRNKESESQSLRSTLICLLSTFVNRCRKEQGNYAKVNDAEGFVTLWHPTRNICIPLQTNLFLNFSTFYLPWWNSFHLFLFS